MRLLMHLFQKIKRGDWQRAYKYHMTRDEDLQMPVRQEASTILYSLEQALDSAGFISAKSDSRCLLGLALNRKLPVLPHEEIVPLDKVSYKRLAVLLKRRLNGEPISRIRGWREFWSLRFAISSATLDPRPDSETLIEAAIKWVTEKPVKKNDLRCLDLGTGSGCLLLALLTELPQASGIGIDIDLDAVAMASKNAASLDLASRAKFYEHSFTDNISCFGDFDIVLANPPYIPSNDIPHLAKDVWSFDPKLALDGGCHGMDCWNGLLPQIATSLHSDGMAFVEIGKGQDAAVVLCAKHAELQLIDSHCDLAGITRCLQFGIKM